ncbi:MAG: hypothetical protein JXQ72_12260 [Anaerolineae bacterium]|nr:hypothetical protein [Anaerolineae bacterium]
MRRALVILLILSVLIPLSAMPPPADALSLRPAPQRNINRQIDDIIASLTPEERVGQLVMVTFEGTYLGPDSAIAQLVSEYNIGGVMLLAEQDNINGQINTPRLVQSLTDDLQRLAHDAAVATQENRANPREYVPLFIATTHSGNGQPGTQIAWGTTPLPSQMALGATWEPDYARQTGQIAGRELSAMGINMLFGPALDVPPQTQAERTLDLGVNVFGGEPYWVGRMGQEYITGVHEGSHDRIAVIAQHFPGLGFADTQPDLEVPVVPRSIEELRAFDLVPFFAVTGEAGDSLARADGLQCANIRYQGQNARSITRPVCVDEQAAGQLLASSDLRDWRDTGLMVSSTLGTSAIRRYYNITPFPHRQIAREAFVAGNDLLFLHNFGPEPGADQIANVIDVIEFFAEGYEDDPVFRTRVDRSLKRILRLKLDLYDGDLSLDNVRQPVNDIDTVGGASVPLYTIAQSSVTLIAPPTNTLPAPPARDDTIVIFTDVRLIQQCSYCAQYAMVDFNALERAIERLYGPYAGAQIRPERVTSFSLNQLRFYLDGDIANANESQFRMVQRIGEALREVDWVVFLILDSSPEVEASTVLHELLDSESRPFEGAHLIVFALGAPTTLSSTQISKLTAYFALYSHTPPFIDTAARALFQETSITGLLPISLPATGYDILERTAPDPAQTIRLRVAAINDQPVAAVSSDIVTVRPGEALILQSDPLLDHNGHSVPDNTPVEFRLTFVTDNLQTRQPTVTRDGVARITFTPTRTGRIQVTAHSEDATRSATLQIVVVDDDTAAASTLTTQAQPTPDRVSPDASPDLALDPSGLNAPPDQADSAPGSDSAPSTTDSAAGTSTGDDSGARRLDLLDLMIALVGLSVMGALGFSAGVWTTYTTTGGLRVVLGSFVAGLTGYIYYGLNAPGTGQIHARLDDLAPLITTLGAGLVGLVYTWLALRVSRR